ncbi:MAG: TonB-dependent receptor [Elusimicrobia bacterium]|nr:TonB-dependent receptor [Elusimicrobiota bacterium]
MKKVLLMLSFLLVNATVFADDVTLSLEKLYEQQDTITTTQEITSQDIEKVNPAQAMEVLKNVPGVLVQKTGDTGRTDPSIRGFGDNCRRIIVLIDGKPEFMSLFGCGVSHSMLAGNVDRVEITKGPDSVLYGSGALGGVINIITKTPTKPLEGSIDVSFGSFNTQNGKIYVGGLQNNVLYEVAANKITSDGHLENSQYNATDVYEKLGYIFRDGSTLIFEAKQFQGLKHEPEARTKDGGKIYGNNYWEDYHRNSYQLKFDKFFSRGHLTVRGYRNDGDHKFSNNWHSKDSLTGAMANYDWEIVDSNLLKLGADYKQQEGELLSQDPIKGKMNIGKWKLYEYAFYALDKHNFTDNFAAVAGARYNKNEISGEQFVPRAGLEYQLTESLLFKGLYSRGFRSPYLNELYLVPAKNENLKPETVDSYEIGADFKKDDFVFNVTGFVMKGDNLIEKVENKIKPPMYTLQNTGDYEFKGVELYLSYIFSKFMDAQAGYTYFDAGDHTQGRPRDKVDLNVNFNISKWSLSLNSMYVGNYYSQDKKQERLNDFAVVSAKLSFAVNDNIKLFVDGENLTNQEYEIFLDRDADNYPITKMPGTAVYFGTQIKF